MENPQDNILKIVQQMHKELATEPVHTHAAIHSMLGVLLQHRATVEQNKAAEAHQRDQFAADLAMGGAVPRPRIV